MPKRGIAMKKVFSLIPVIALTSTLMSLDQPGQIAHKTPAQLHESAAATNKKLADIFRQKIHHHKALAELSTSQANFSTTARAKSEATLDKELHTAVAKLYDTKSRIHDELAKSTPTNATLKKLRAQAKEEKAELARLKEKIRNRFQEFVRGKKTARGTFKTLKGRRLKAE
jgi:hypothetical protein